MADEPIESLAGRTPRAEPENDGGWKERADERAAPAELELRNVQRLSRVRLGGLALDDEGNVITNGGRVLGICGMGPTIKDSIKLTYQAVKKVNFD